MSSPNQHFNAADDLLHRSNLGVVSKTEAEINALKAIGHALLAIAVEIQEQGRVRY